MIRRLCEAWREVPWSHLGLFILLICARRRALKFHLQVGLQQMLLECLLFLPAQVKLWSCQNSPHFYLWMIWRSCLPPDSVMVSPMKRDPKILRLLYNQVLMVVTPLCPTSFYPYPTYQSSPPLDMPVRSSLKSTNIYRIPTMCKPLWYL